MEMHQMFSVHTTPVKFKNATSIGHFDLCLRKTRSGKSQVFRLHKDEKPAFSNSPGLKSVFEKLRFGDG